MDEFDPRNGYLEIATIQPEPGQPYGLVRIAIGDREEIDGPNTNFCVLPMDEAWAVANALIDAIISLECTADERIRQS